jgi:hypothetical protein
MRAKPGKQNSQENIDQKSCNLPRISRFCHLEGETQDKNKECIEIHLLCVNVEWTQTLCGEGFTSHQHL